MAAGREEKPADFFYFVFLRFRLSNFPEREAKGGAFVRFLPTTAVLLVCIPAGQEDKSALIY